MSKSRLTDAQWWRRVTRWGNYGILGGLSMARQNLRRIEQLRIDDRVTLYELIRRSNDIQSQILSLSQDVRTAIEEQNWLEAHGITVATKGQDEPIK